MAPLMVSLVTRLADSDLAQDDDDGHRQKDDPAHHDENHQALCPIDCQEPSSGNGRNREHTGEDKLTPAGKNIEHRQQQHREEQTGQHAG